MNSRQTAMRSLRAVLIKLPLMLTCVEFEAFVLDYFEGTLSSGQRAIFKMHLMVCQDCQRYLAAYKRSVDMGQNVFKKPYEPVPEDVPEDLVQAILAAKKAE